MSVKTFVLHCHHRIFVDIRQLGNGCVVRLGTNFLYLIVKRRLLNYLLIYLVALPHKMPAYGAGRQQQKKK